MKLKFTIITLLLGICLNGICQAQDSTAFLSELDGLRDPFVPQIPEVIPKSVEAPKEVKIEPPVNPDAFKADVINTPVISKPAPQPVLMKPTKNNLETLVVKGIVWNTNLPQAIINDTIVYVGDVVNGMEIKAIRQGSIDLSNQGVLVTISVDKTIN